MRAPVLFALLFGLGSLATGCGSEESAEQSCTTDKDCGGGAYCARIIDGDGSSMQCRPALSAPAPASTEPDTVQDNVVDFGSLTPGTLATAELFIRNNTGDRIDLNALQYVGARVFHPTESPTAELDDRDPWFHSVEPGEVRSISVVYESDGLPASAALTADFGGIRTVFKLKANQQSSVLEANVPNPNLGAVLVGKTAERPVRLDAIGGGSSRITSVRVSDDSSPGFTVRFTWLDGTNTAPTLADPVVIQPNITESLFISYSPQDLSPLSADGTPVPSTATIIIENDGWESEVRVQVTGLAVATICPWAVGGIAEGEQVIPQTVLHLTGNESSAPYGQVTKVLWEVVQPEGSVQTFSPHHEFVNPTFSVDVAGTYEFQLTVWDNSGLESCVPWHTTVLVIPDEAIHVELLWHTPADSDETDQGPEAGSDLDLHLVHLNHAYAETKGDGNGPPDPWFVAPFDCFWFNAHPNWGLFDPSADDDPGLDLDDTDGAGPENVNLDFPERGTDYGIGVHYWKDHGFGTSYATLRIYIHANLVSEIENVKLEPSDLWNAATISWPDATVETVPGADEKQFHITSNYMNPFLESSDTE